MALWIGLVGVFRQAEQDRLAERGAIDRVGHGLAHIRVGEGRNQRSVPVGNDDVIVQTARIADECEIRRTVDDCRLRVREPVSGIDLAGLQRVEARRVIRDLPHLVTLETDLVGVPIGRVGRVDLNLALTRRVLAVDVWAGADGIAVDRRIGHCLGCQHHAARMGQAVDDGRVLLLELDREGIFVVGLRAFDGLQALDDRKLDTAIDVRRRDFGVERLAIAELDALAQRDLHVETVDLVACCQKRRRLAVRIPLEQRFIDGSQVGYAAAALLLRIHGYELHLLGIFEGAGRFGIRHRCGDAQRSPRCKRDKQPSRHRVHCHSSLLSAGQPRWPSRAIARHVALARRGEASAAPEIRRSVSAPSFGAAGTEGASRSPQRNAGPSATGSPSTPIPGVCG